MPDHIHPLSNDQAVLPADEFGIADTISNNGDRNGERGGIDHSEHHNHHHDHTDSILRLKTTEGHLRGIQRMLEQDVYCIDILRQIQAVQAALSKISVSILNQHLNTCVITAVRNEDPHERERVMKEIVEIFETKPKI